MIQKIFTIKELSKTGLPIVGSYQCSDTKIGEYYLQAEVISQWDWEDYSEFYTYFDNDINHVVMLNHKTDEKTTKYEPLKKDFSNVPVERVE
jgi:hypothetical protein